MPVKKAEYRKQWEIVFRLEQKKRDKNYQGRVKNYEKILGLMKKLRDVLITEGIPLGFSIIDRKSGIMEGVDEIEEEKGVKCFGGVVPEELIEFR